MSAGGRAEHLRTISASDTANEGMVLSKAVIRAADFLDLPNKLLAQVVGLSEASVSRMRNGLFVVSPGSKSFELAQLFVRLFRSLDAIVGGDDAALNSWMRTTNLALGGKPIDLIRDVTGLVMVLQYVDSRRAPL